MKKNLKDKKIYKFTNLMHTHGLFLLIKFRPRLARFIDYLKLRQNKPFNKFVYIEKKYQQM